MNMSILILLLSQFSTWTNKISLQREKHKYNSPHFHHNLITSYSRLIRLDVNDGNDIILLEEIIRAKAPHSGNLTLFLSLQLAS